MVGGIAMAFADLVISRLQLMTPFSASDSVGMARDERVGAFSHDSCLTESTLIPSTPGQERLAERARIAQELHDTLLQGFFSVSMQLHAAVENLAEDCLERQRFGEVLVLLDRVLAQGRSALHRLRSPDERSGSLSEAFARIPNDLGFPSATGFRLVVLGREQELRAGLFDEVYRIGFEAIVNAFRHSRASDIETEVEYRPTELRLTVRDNGCGISPEDLQWGRSGHWGLQGMRERAERIGARLRLWSRVTLGTEVELWVPGRTAFEQVQDRAGRRYEMP